MADIGFDLVDALQIEVRAFAYSLGGSFGNDPSLSQGFRGGHLDRQPGAEAILIAPDATHFGAGIAWDQGVTPSLFSCENRGLRILNAGELSG